jgi:hypothetical protein
MLAVGVEPVVIVLAQAYLSQQGLLILLLWAAVVTLTQTVVIQYSAQ